jgi:hypothetical protein
MKLLLLPNQTRNETAVFARANIVELGKPANQRIAVSTDEFSLFEKNGFGRTWVSFAGKPSVLRTRDRIELAQRLQAVRALVVLDALENGALPESTAATGVLDPYTGKPFRIDPQSGRIWSIGEDGLDRGGQKRNIDRTSLHNMRDPTIRIFPPQNPPRSRRGSWRGHRGQP